MYEVIVLWVLALIVLAVASLQDLKKREVMDWLGFFLIISAIGFRLFYSLFNNNFNFLYEGVIGLGIFFIIGNLLYYSHFFAGGDAKLMISLGAILPFSLSSLENIQIYLSFLFIFLFAGMIYTMAWSIFLTIKHYSLFKTEFKKRFEESWRYGIFMVLFGILIIIFNDGYLWSIIGILILVSYPLIIFTKSIEFACMIKKISVKDLREGDWLYKNTSIGKKMIIAKWDGLTRSEIELLRKKCRFVTIKQGIPFVPVFLISFTILILFYLWNPFWQSYFFFF